MLLLGCGAGAQMTDRPAAAQPARPAETQAATGPAAPGVPRVIPWIEVGGDSPAELGNIVAGLEIWRQVTDTAIVSVNPGRSGLYSVLRRRVPGMRIVPGLKTWPLLKTFDSESGWESIAKELTRIAEVSGARTVLLENETAIRPYLEGKVDVDLAGLRRGLEKLPRDLEIIWYPGIHGEAKLKHARSTAVCELVATVCRGVRFTDTDSAGPNAGRQWWAGQARRQMRTLSSGRPTLPILYTCGGRFWRPQQILAALARVENTDAIIYTGSENWLADTRTIVEHLTEARAAARSPVAQGNR